jgi:hypothetical protein
LYRRPPSALPNRTTDCPPLFPIRIWNNQHKRSMKTFDRILLAVAVIFALKLLVSCGTEIAYEGKFATYSVDEQGNIIIHPKIHSVK